MPMPEFKVEGNADNRKLHIIVDVSDKAFRDASPSKSTGKNRVISSTGGNIVIPGLPPETKLGMNLMCPDSIVSDRFGDSATARAAKAAETTERPARKGK